MRIEAGRIIASCFALTAFAVALVAGISGGNDAAQILLRAVIAMVVCYPVGLIAGLICERVIQAHVTARPNDAEDMSVNANNVPAQAATEGSGAVDAPMASDVRAAA